LELKFHALSFISWAKAAFEVSEEIPWMSFCCGNEAKVVGSDCVKDKRREFLKRLYLLLIAGVVVAELFSAKLEEFELGWVDYSFSVLRDGRQDGFR
jgi:hypothetical protein